VSQTERKTWPFVAQWLVLGLASAVASYLAYTHVVLTHGAATFDSLCNLGGALNCDAVNTSEWSSLLGAPISAWALPVYAAMAWLASSARSDTERGRKAQGALVALAGFNVAFSVFLAGVSVLDLGFVCLFCITLYTLHTASFVLALVPAGGRRPALPDAADLAPTGGLLAVTTAAAVGGTILWARQLDDAVVAGFGEPSVTTLESELVDAGMVRLPELVRQDVAGGAHSPTWGNPDAAVTVVEFADFECGYCRKLSFGMEEMRARYGDRVKFVFRHYPMDLDCNDAVSRTHHERACEAALAAQCAHEQGKFWEVHDQLFRNQKRLEDVHLLDYATRAGVDVEQWRTCMATGAVARESLRDDIRAAQQLGITGTPRTYVAGREFNGAVSERILDAAIRVALGEASADPLGNVAARRTEVVAEAPPMGPIDMVRHQVAGRTFYIDAVEASLDANGAARAIVGASPAAASWFAARDACAAAGKRLCKQEEWLAACTGADPVDNDGNGVFFEDFVEGNLYPYGGRYLESACWESDDPDRGGAAPAARLPGCRTPAGVYDLAGNVQEWVGDTAASSTLAGGAWYYEDKANCGANYAAFGGGYSNATTGFRCCADAPPAPDHLVAAVAPPSAPTGAGQPLPTFSAPQASGVEFGSADLVGKVALINFWASWCGPCQRELPALVGLQNDFGARGFTVVAVNVDRQRAPADRFIARIGANYPVIFDPESRIMGLFDARAMPTSVLVDRNGNVVLQHTGFSDAWLADLRAQIDGLLGP
jgi:protein-disulfide isomerase/thiol-disulfide isomerase/thioredoxin/uncharacterized membrane protein